MGIVWENQYDCEPERTDVYVLQTTDQKYEIQLSIGQIKEQFEPEEFGLMLEGTHPIWIAFKRN